MDGLLQRKSERIRALCLNETSANPYAVAVWLMHDPLIAIHGPEHHILDGAALLTAAHNAGLSFDLAEALDELARRGEAMPGAICGYWGVCGSAASVGAALSILWGTSPLSDGEPYRRQMRATSRALSAIAEIGGPRCCKRNAFLSLQSAASLLREQGVALEGEPPVCSFFPKNEQCIGARCPFRPGKSAT